MQLSAKRTNTWYGNNILGMTPRVRIPVRKVRITLMSLVHSRKKTKNGTLVFKLSFSLQNKGYRLTNFAGLNLFSLKFGVFRLLLIQ